MTKSLCILVRRAPYGMIHAAEAFRHLVGAQAFGFKVTTILMDDGVYMAKDNQATEAFGWTSLSKSLRMGLEAQSNQNFTVYLHEDSMKERGMLKEDLVEGIELINDKKMAEPLSSSDHVMLF